MVASKPASGLSGIESKAISEGRRKTEEEADKSNRERYKNQATSGLTEKERIMISESRRKTEEEAEKKDSIKTANPAPSSPLPALPSQEWSPNAEHVRLGGEHMMTLYHELKRLPTHAEHVKYLEKEMNITEAQAEKILKEMDID